VTLLVFVSAFSFVQAEPRTGAGIFANSVPAGRGGFGMGLLVYDFPINASINMIDGVFHEGSASVAWLGFNGRIGDTDTDWYVGPGVYADVILDYPGLRLKEYGGRAILGVRTIYDDIFETHVSVGPSLGVTGTSFFANSGKIRGSLDIEVGVRLLLPSEAKTPGLTATRPDVPWSPDGDGTNDKFALAVKVQGMKPIATWNLKVADPTGVPFYSLEGTGRIPSTIQWNGKSMDGILVDSDQTYSYTVSATDTEGQTQSASGRVTTDILLIKIEKGWQLDLASLVFQPSKADLVDDDSAAGKSNAATLAKLSGVLKRMQKYNIAIIGHAVNISGTIEEEAELLKLSAERAVTVKNALVKLGIPAAKLTTEGKGGKEPLVPHSDEVNRWKNRRVEFLLTD